MKRRFALGCAAGMSVALWSVAPLAAQIATSESQARRDSLAARVDSGVVLAFGGRTPVTDFGPFFQVPAFHYLTGYDYADAALIMVVHGGRGTGTRPCAPCRRANSSAASRPIIPTTCMSTPTCADASISAIRTP